MKLAGIALLLVVLTHVSAIGLVLAPLYAALKRIARRGDAHPESDARAPR